MVNYLSIYIKDFPQKILKNDIRAILAYHTLNNLFIYISKRLKSLFIYKNQILITG